MLEYLDRMHSNLQCLSSSYEAYLEAVRQLDQAAEGLAEPLWAFAGVHPPAKVLFTIIAQTTSAQKEQLEMAQGVLESTVQSFWTSTDAQEVREGTLKNMVTGASNEYNVAMAKALANTRPDKYEAALQGANGAKCAAAKHNVSRWNYISTLERLAHERELETNRLFSRFLDAQCEIADLNRTQHERMVPEIQKAQEQIKHDTTMMKRMSKAQQQYQLRLSLKIDRTQLDSEAEQLPGVEFTAHTAEGLVFMKPNVLSSGAKKMKVPWLPAWMSINFSSGDLHYNARWQGPVAGMDQALHKDLDLEGHIHVRSSTVNGLDADNPNRTSLRRLFLFEVEQMAEPDGGGVSVAPVVRLFQALSPADMDQWKQAFEQAMQGEVASPSTGGDPSISGPIHLQPRALDMNTGDARERVALPASLSGTSATEPEPDGYYGGASPGGL